MKCFVAAHASIVVHVPLSQIETFIMLGWFNRSNPSRRQTAAQWHNQYVSQATEVLEIRVVPAKDSCIDPGTYQQSDAPAEDLRHELSVDPGGKTGTFDAPGYGRFFVKIHCKKKGEEIVIRPHTEGLSGKITLKRTPTGYHADVNLQDKGAGYFDSDHFEMNSPP